jgi:recombination protein RecR
MGYPSTIKNLINCFKKLPGIGEKTAERLALAILKLDDEMIDLFVTSLSDIKSKVKRCSICNNFTEEDICDICNDNRRDHSTICIVEEPKNIILFERIGKYNGLYHVLNGLISPLEGINPEDINIDALFKRIEDGDIKEIIIAVKPSIEGETTALYISKMLEGKNVIVSKIAHGVPIGADIDYIDAITLELALEDRKKIS